MSDALHNLYKIRGDVLEALIDKLEKDLTEMVRTVTTVRAALAEQDKKYHLTSGKGGMTELYATVRKNFPQYADATDEEILKAFGGGNGGG